MVTIGPTGKLVTGRVLDVAKVPFERALREIDKRLYVRWNPDKLIGNGCWEIRIKPGKKTALYQGSYQGMNFYELDYLETDTIHHVLDCAFLNFDAIRKLKEMDTTNPKHFIHSLEYDEQVRVNEQTERALAERKYAIKQNKKAISDLYEMVRSGQNIHRILGSFNDWTLKADK